MTWTRMQALWRALVLATGVASGLSATPLCGPSALRGDLRAHDPSRILKVDGRYYLFYTGRDVAMKSSGDLRRWFDGGGVLKEPPAWARDVVPRFRRSYWAPDVVKLGDQYFLYYSVSTFGSQRSAIGLATNRTVNPDGAGYEWQDQGIVIASDRTSPFNAIDPAILADDDGKLWMAFGSFWGGIHVVELDPATGKRLNPATPAVNVAKNLPSTEIEAAYLHKRGKSYYLFVNWGKCCRGVNSTYNIRVGRGERPTGPFIDRDGVDMVAGGGTLLMATAGARIGPGHASIVAEGGVEYLSFHYYDGDDRGRSKLGLCVLEWSADGWPTAKDLPAAP